MLSFVKIALVVVSIQSNKTLTKRMVMFKLSRSQNKTKQKDVNFRKGLTESIGVCYRYPVLALTLN